MFYLSQTTMLYRTLPETCLLLFFIINTALMGLHGGLGVYDKNADCLLLATSTRLSVQGVKECQAMNEDISEIANSFQHTVILN